MELTSPGDLGPGLGLSHISLLFSRNLLSPAPSVLLEIGKQRTASCLKRGLMSAYKLELLLVPVFIHSVKNILGILRIWVQIVQR